MQKEGKEEGLLRREILPLAKPDLRGRSLPGEWRGREVANLTTEGDETWG